MTAIAETSAAARAALASPGVTVHESVAEMLDHAALDGVLIAAPTDQHTAIIADDDAGLYGMRRIRAEHPSHPYAAQWWPIGQGVGCGASFANQAADLLEGWPDAPWTPGFREGAAVQAVCEAMEISAASGRWVSIGEVVASTL